jgi:hypothetical protein
MTEQYETIKKFDRAYGSLLGGNNLHTKPSTIKEVNSLTGESETFVVQTIRAEQKRTITKGFEQETIVTVGDYIVIEYIDRDGHQRIILPPRVVETIHRGHDSLSARARSNKAKALAKERKLRGELPGFMRNKSQEASQ